MLQRSFTGLVGVLAFVAMLAMPSAASADACSPGTVDKTWDGSVEHRLVRRRQLDAADGEPAEPGPGRVHPDRHAEPRR